MNTPRNVNLILAMTLSLLAVHSSHAAVEEPYSFESAHGEKVNAFKGSFEVPENRSNPESRKIPINYVRFPATGQQKGSPIVYLSGGPGGSGIGTAKRDRFPLFMAMREFGDVIALDQRGTGKARKQLTCRSSLKTPLNQAIIDTAYYEIQRQALTECANIWKKSGVDLSGYTTLESVTDLDDLRKNLGVKKISLWGISYGSHLALAALKQMDDRIDRVIIATVEGLDQTIKMPFRTDAYFDRLQNALNRNKELAKQFPDIKKLISRVLNNLNSQPLKLSLTDNEKEASILWQRRDMQQISAGMISDPGSALILLKIYAALDNNNTRPLTDLLQRYGAGNRPISFSAMPVAMDLASGQSEQRYAKIMEQAKTSLLSSHLNSSIHLSGVIDGLDLGESFREKPNSNVPTLVLIGSLDGRIYPDSQREATSGLTQREVITIVNAGHNLFMTSPEVGETIAQFMRGKPIKKTEITVDLPW